MANPEQLNLLRSGIENWNAWRKKGTAKIDLCRAKLSGAHLDHADLSNAELGEATLINSHLERVNLDGANLTAADLSGAVLAKARLRANLTAASIYKANLSGANASEANFTKARLDSSDVTGANLNGANFSSASLKAVVLCRAQLERTNFNWADLRGAKLDGAICAYTQFGDSNLAQSSGLDSIHHKASSVVSIGTVFLSNGAIPNIFLQGAGVPDAFITYAKSLAGTPIEFYSCFVSYSARDQEFADRLFTDLQARGVRCWFAPHDIQGGRKIHEQIDEAIRVHDKLLLILSKASMNSNWVKTEIANARDREGREGRQMLFPITIEPF